MTVSGGAPLIAPKVSASRNPKKKKLPRGFSHPTKGALGPVKMRGAGFVVRFAPIKGVTPHRCLDRRIYLPAMLDTFTVDETALHNEYDTLTAGHFSMAAMGPPTARQFRTMSIDAITVEFDTPWMVATGQDSHVLRTKLYEILRYRKAVHMLVTFHPKAGDPAEFSGTVTFRDISKDVRPGENESRYLTISISEWRDPSADRRSSQPSGSSRKSGVQLPSTHVLRATDTLSSLSHEYYGRYDWWRAIRDANGLSKKFGQKTPLVSLPGRWKVGYKVKIPGVGKGEPAVGLADPLGGRALSGSGTGSTIGTL